MEVVLPGAKVLTNGTIVSNRNRCDRSYDAYHRHLLAFRACIITITEALGHNRIVAETSPEEHAHLAVLTWILIQYKLELFEQ